MNLVDLTLEIPTPGRTETRTLRQADGARYVARVHAFVHSSMAGTYVDLPGHIQETDDGQDAAGFPAADLFRIESDVIHLDRASDTGAVTAAELAAADPAPPGRAAPGLVVNALGARRFDAIRMRSVWLAPDAVRWITARGVRLLVSDVYESPGLHGVFSALFRSRITTVCQPVDLHCLTAARVRLTVLFPRFRGVTQLPCRVVAEREPARKERS